MKIQKENLKVIIYNNNLMKYKNKLLHTARQFLRKEKHEKLRISRNKVVVLESATKHKWTT